MPKQRQQSARQCNVFTVPNVAQKQRATEQAIRDAAKQEAVEVYKTFSKLDLEIVVDVRSFTITHLAEPEEIILPDYPATAKQQPVVLTHEPYIRPAEKSYRDPNKVSKVSGAGKKFPVLVASEPHKSTKLKTPSSRKARVMNCAPVKSKNRKVKPRQSGIFKRFTLLVVGYIREKFLWARKKFDKIDADHDKRIAENYVFDEVQGIYLSRAEFEKRDRFNSDTYSPTPDEISRFPRRPLNKQALSDSSFDLKLSVSPEQTRQSPSPRMKPPG